VCAPQTMDGTRRERNVVDKLHKGEEGGWGWKYSGGFQLSERPVFNKTSAARHGSAASRRGNEGSWLGRSLWVSGAESFVLWGMELSVSRHGDNAYLNWRN
jgi:hypothetical protein